MFKNDKICSSPSLLEKNDIEVNEPLYLLAYCSMVWTKADVEFYEKCPLYRLYTREHINNAMHPNHRTVAAGKCLARDAKHIAHDCPSLRGASGGVVVDGKGQVVGIHTGVRDVDVHYNINGERRLRPDDLNQALTIYSDPVKAQLVAGMPKWMSLYWKNVLIRFSISYCFFQLLVSFLSLFHFIKQQYEKHDLQKWKFSWAKNCFLMISWRYLSDRCLNFFIQIQLWNMTKKISLSYTFVLILILNDRSRVLILIWTIWTLKRLRRMFLIIICTSGVHRNFLRGGGAVWERTAIRRKNIFVSFFLAGRLFCIA